MLLASSQYLFLHPWMSIPGTKKKKKSKNPNVFADATVSGVVQRRKKCKTQQKETGSDGLSSQPPCEKGQGRTRFQLNNCTLPRWSERQLSSLSRTPQAKDRAHHTREVTQESSGLSMNPSMHIYSSSGKSITLLCRLLALHSKALTNSQPVQTEETGNRGGKIVIYMKCAEENLYKPKPKNT